MATEKEHDLLVKQIIDSIKADARKQRKKAIFKRTNYRIKQGKKEKIGNPDIILLIERTLYILEIKIPYDAKAREQVIQYVKDFDDYDRFLQQTLNMSYGNIKAFWLSEDGNMIESIQTQATIALNPNFLDSPIGFMENN